MTITALGARVGSTLILIISAGKYPQSVKGSTSNKMNVMNAMRDISSTPTTNVFKIWLMLTASHSEKEFVWSVRLDTTSPNNISAFSFLRTVKNSMSMQKSALNVMMATSPIIVPVLYLPSRQQKYIARNTFTRNVLNVLR